MTQHLTCRELVALITEYLELALAAEERARVEEHLAACVDCRAYLDQIQWTIRAARMLHADEAASDARRAALLTLYRGWLAHAGGPSYDQR